MFKSQYEYPEWYNQKTYNFYKKKLTQIKRAKNIHSDSASYYEKLHFRIYGPSIVITGLSGVASFLSSSSIFSNNTQTGIAIGVGILASVSAMIQSIASAVDYSTKSKIHRETAEEFEKLVTRIEFEMEMPNEETFLNDLEVKILDIQNKCKYFPPRQIVSQYEKIGFVMPEKWKESVKDRKGNQTHYYLRNTPTDELQEALTSGSIA